MVLGFVSFVLNFFHLHLEGEIPKQDLFYTLTGYYCPGCGGTRSLEFFLTGHFVKSFLYHPAVFYSIIMLIVYALSHIVHRIADKLDASNHLSTFLKKIPYMLFHPGYFYVLIAIILFQWVIKNAIYFFSGVHII